jgi:hypothetical protein
MSENDRARYHTLIINMRTLPLCNSWERLMIVDDMFIVVDRRFGQSLRRWWHGDNRHTVVSFLQRMVSDVSYFLTSGSRSITREMKDRIVTLIPCFRTALARVKSVYANDTITSFRLENIIDEVDTIQRSVEAPT